MLTVQLGSPVSIKNGVGSTERLNMPQGGLKKWFSQKWVRVGTDGKIKGPCGKKKAQKNPDRCLPSKKARSLSKSQRAATAKKKKSAGRKGQRVVRNTRKSRVRS